MMISIWKKTLVCIELFQRFKDEGFRYQMTAQDVIIGIHYLSLNIYGSILLNLSFNSV